MLTLIFGSRAAENPSTSRCSRATPWQRRKAPNAPSVPAVTTTCTRRRAGCAQLRRTELMTPMTPAHCSRSAATTTCTSDAPEVAPPPSAVEEEDVEADIEEAEDVEDGDAALRRPRASDGSACKGSGGGGGGGEGGMICGAGISCACCTTSAFGAIGTGSTVAR